MNPEITPAAAGMAAARAETLTEAVRAALVAAGYSESISPDGPAPQPTPATFWPLGFMVSDYGRGAGCVTTWDQVFARDRTPAQYHRHTATLAAYTETLEAAGYTVHPVNPPHASPWLVVTR